MIILLFFHWFSRGEKCECSKNITVVLNLFAEIIAHSAFFISISMYQKMGIKSNNAFFKISERPIISLSMYFSGIPPLLSSDLRFMEWQQQEISDRPSIKNEIKDFYSGV